MTFHLFHRRLISVMLLFHPKLLLSLPTSVLDTHTPTRTHTHTHTHTRSHTHTHAEAGQAVMTLHLFHRRLISVMLLFHPKLLLSLPTSILDTRTHTPTPTHNHAQRKTRTHMHTRTHTLTHTHAEAGQAVMTLHLFHRRLISVMLLFHPKLLLSLPTSILDTRTHTRTTTHSAKHAHTCTHAHTHAHTHTC